jgi:hypothetical protein
MAFIHIPIPEYRGAGLMIGSRNETVTAPQYNAGFYDDGEQIDWSCQRPTFSLALRTVLRVSRGRFCYAAFPLRGARTTSA